MGGGICDGSQEGTCSNKQDLNIRILLGVIFSLKKDAIREFYIKFMGFDHMVPMLSLS